MDEFPRYRKKTKRHPPAKSDHKHSYTYCVFHERIKTPFGYNEEFRIGIYCSVCGKIGSTGFLERDGWLENVAQRPWVSHEWTAKAKMEFAASTRSLPCFEIFDAVRQKFVNVNQEGQVESNDERSNKNQAVL